ncbi:MAG: hypothetical protein M3Z06_06335 [Actinomycetota bacterium]|nr:hypothetical protein [Actinomycetota bacterium]
MAQFAPAAVILIALVGLCWHFDAKPRHEALTALPDTVRVLLATGVLFGVSGFGLVRLLLPDALRRYELLWVLPTGGCAVGLAMTVMGFVGVPYAVSLALVLGAGLALAVYSVRRLGWPVLPGRRLAWPVFLAFVVVVVALVPMIFVQHYAAPVGTGSDAHMAAGTASFLKHAYPTGTDLGQPINQMPPTWQSKFPIYYAFAGVSSVSGLPTWQVLAPLAAALLAMAAIGLFLVAREVFGATAAISLAAMGLAGLDRMALHTGLNPYFNQTWGFFALPFTVVLGWLAVQSGVSRRPRQATVVLLGIFALVLVLAYPLAAPIPAVPIVVFVWSERRRRIKAGEQVVTIRDFYKGRRSLLWMVPVAAALAIPVAGAVDKGVAAAQVLAPGHSLQGWGGDLGHFIPFSYFLSLPNSLPGIALFVVIVLLALRGLAGQPRSLAVGLGGLLVIGLLLAAYLRHRQYGYYFHFKLLAFIGPVLLVIAAVGAGRLRRAGPALLAVLALAGGVSVFDELKATGYQLPLTTVQLSSWAKALPQGTSIRLDMWPPQQLWAAYFLVSRPLCSQLPLLDTDYPHVPRSRKADYILTTANLPKPADAIGAPLRTNEGYRLYRENPAVPGPSVCSARRQDRIYSGLGHSYH